MSTRSISITSAILIALSLPLAQAAVNMPGTISVADLREETRAKKTLRQAQESAATVADEAGQLRMIVNSTSSPDAQLAQLGILRGDVNRMGREISSLTEERESLPPWEQQAVDTVLPLVRATAANMENVIDYFNENRDRSWTKRYHDHVEGVSRNSEQIAKTLKDCLKYDQLRDQELQVEERIWTDSGE